MAKKQNKQKRRSSATSKPRKSKPLSNELSQALAQGLALHQAGRLNDAVNIYQKILSQRPDSSQANFLCGALLMGAGNLQAAEQFLNNAVAYDPTELKHYSTLGELLCSIGKYEEAEQVLETALKIKKNDFVSLHNYGVSLINQNKFELARQTFEQAIATQGNHAPSLNNMGNALVGLWRASEALSYFKKALAADSSFLFSASNLLLNSNYSEKATPKELIDLHLHVGKKFRSTLEINPERKEGHKVRIGFVSGDFYTHAVATFFQPLLEGLNRERYEIYLYHNSALVDSTTHRIKTFADKWRETAAFNDTDFIQTVQSDELDIAIDLSGHTNCNRLNAFAARLAPIQINWLGYPNITGLAAMDYRLVDEQTDPVGESEGTKAEALVRLPGCFLCYEGNENIPVAQQPPCIENGFVTFGSFNNLLKINDEVIKAWAKLLKQVDRSKLLLKSKQLGEPSVRERVCVAFESLGVSSDRLELLGNLPSTSDHMELYCKVDIALDCFPYNGTTTTCEAMWMGVPVLCVKGDRHASRVGSSLLVHSDCHENLAEDLDQYIARAESLAGNFDEIVNYRQGLRARLQNSTLGNRQKLVTGFESVIEDLLA